MPYLKNVINFKAPNQDMFGGRSDSSISNVPTDIMKTILPKHSYSSIQIRFSNGFLGVLTLSPQFHISEIRAYLET